jgi:lysyl-tRNA synthetase class II
VAVTGAVEAFETFEAFVAGAEVAGEESAAPVEAATELAAARSDCVSGIPPAAVGALPAEAVVESSALSCKGRIVLRRSSGNKGIFMVLKSSNGKLLVFLSGLNSVSWR